jgi:hypothetical protein
VIKKVKLICYFTKSHENDQIGLPYGLVKFGLLDKQTESLKGDAADLECQFWQKLGQAEAYLLLLQESKGVWLCEQPLLLCILVATRNYKKSRLAFFHCEPKRKQNEWRMAFLWRNQCEGMDELSKAFGYFLNGLNYLQKRREDLAPNSEVVWEYLGPHCSKIRRRNNGVVSVFCLTLPLEHSRLKIFVIRFRNGCYESTVTVFG